MGLSWEWWPRISLASRDRSSFREEGWGQMQESTKVCLRRNNSRCIFKLLEYNYCLPLRLCFLSAVWKLFDARSFFFHFLLTKHGKTFELSAFDMLEQGLCLLDTNSTAALFPCWRNLWMTQWVTTQLHHCWKFLEPDWRKWEILEGIQAQKDLWLFLIKVHAQCVCS